MQKFYLLIFIIGCSGLISSCTRYVIRQGTYEKAPFGKKYADILVEIEGNHYKLENINLDKNKKIISARLANPSKDNQILYRMAILERKLESNEYAIEHLEIWNKTEKSCFQSNHLKTLPKPILIHKKQLHIFSSKPTLSDTTIQFNNNEIDSVLLVKNFKNPKKLDPFDLKFGNHEVVIWHTSNKVLILKKIEKLNNSYTAEISPITEELLVYNKSSLSRAIELKEENKNIKDSLRLFKDSLDHNLILHRQYQITLDTFQQIEDTILFKLNQIKETTLVERKNRNGIVTGIAVTSTSAFLGVGLGLAIGYGLSNICGCPHNYIYNGENYVYSSTLFTGAAHQKLERNDYKIIPDYDPNSAEIDLLIKNEMDEIQYTNLVELWVIEHDSSSQIAVDQQGGVYACSNEIAPIECSNGSRQDLLSLVQYRDEATYDFDALSKNQFSEVFLRFNSPRKKENARLILKLKNQMWGKFVFDQFSALFGDWHSKWQEKKRKQSEKKVKKEVMESGLLLTVAIKTKKGWKTIETIELQGDISFNTLAVPIDSKWLQEEDLELRLQSGFKFWNLDYVALDTNEHQTLSIQKVKAENVPKSLQKDDDDYLVHQKGDEQKLSFKNLKSNQNRTLIMHSKGYYLTTKTFSGKTAISTLLKINKKGGLSWYSWYLFDQLLTAQDRK